jgi:ribosomal protein S18 acetylase RimI-like enzyme
LGGQLNVSFYSDYLRERTSDDIIETDKGFVTYRIQENEKSVYIIDIYVHPDFRREKVASVMADEVVTIAKQRGCTKLFGSVVPTCKGANASLKVLLGYGMILDSSAVNFILFRKEI